VLRMIDCRTGGGLDVDLADLVRGGVFYDEGGVYVRAQVLNRCPRIVTDAGLICLFGEIERAFKADGRVPKLVRCQGAWGHVGV
jgi:hypothetical protein